MLIADIFSPEIVIVVAVVVLLLFGGTKLPELARGLGNAKREFEKASTDDDAKGTTSTTTESSRAASDET
jgi:sec-independent protein translocase protein TatA